MVSSSCFINYRYRVIITNNVYYRTLVYILLNLSKKINAISISVTDNDGQFLLIEAADHLPDWLGPESAGNRVWLRCGQVIIVPYDEPGRQRDGSIELSAALQYLRKKAAVPSQDSGPDSSWMKKMNKHIRSRTIDVFPAKATIQEHVVACILPKIISELLQKSPELISVAVSAFCSYNNNARLQQSRKRASCSSSSQSDKSPRQPTLPLLLDSSLSDATSLTVAPVRFTRALYAKLVFQKFHPPRKFHSLMRLVSSSGSKRVISAFELGCKLCVGLEQAALHELTVCIPAVEAVRATDEHWKRFLLSARSYGFNLSDEGTMKRLSDLFQGKSIIISSSCEGFDSFAAFSALFESTYGRAKEILDGIQISPLISSRETIAAAAAAVVVVSSFDDEEQSNFLRNQIFAPVLKKTVRNDSDAWLYMTPEELDVEMNKRMQAEAGVAARPSEVVVSEEEGDANSKGKEAEAGAISGDDEAKQMQDIIDGIKTFMAGKSDYDGVQVNNKNKNNKTTTTKKEKKKHNITASTTAMGSSSNIAEDISDFGNLDFDYISNMLQNTGNNAQGDTLNDDEDDGDDDDEEDEEGDDDSDGDDSDDYSEAESDPVQNSSSEIRAAASSGLGRFTIPRGRLREDNLAAEDSEAEEQSDELDSDDEVAGDNDGGRFRGTGKANKGRSRPPVTIADYQVALPFIWHKCIKCNSYEFL